jgi:mono/diheme cytochrome c family protein
MIWRFFRAGVPFGAAGLLALWPAAISSHNPITTTVLYSREVAAILNQKCSQCHVADGMAMALQSYAEVRPWAVAIKEEILARKMPPWPAERGYGAFANDLSLTQREQEFLISWIDGGVPEGTGEPPPHQDHSGHWMLGQPDGIYPARQAGAISGPGSARLTISPGFPTDVWVRAFDFKPGDRRSIRAAFFSVAGTGQYLGGWTPWYSSIQFPEGAASRLPAKAAITVDVLYGSSTAPSELPQLGLYFTKAPSQEVTTVELTGERVSDEGRMRSELSLTADQALVGARVEMSTGARSLELKAMRPDGSVEPLLWIKEFRPDWQSPYVFRVPVPLARGSVIVATAFFDPASTSPRLRVVVNGMRPRQS